MALTVGSGLPNNTFTATFPSTFPSLVYSGNLVMDSVANTYTSSSNEDFSAASFLKLPSGTGYAPAAPGDIGYDSAQNAFVGETNQAAPTKGFLSRTVDMAIPALPNGDVVCGLLGDTTVFTIGTNYGTLGGHTTVKCNTSATFAFLTTFSVPASAIFLGKGLRVTAGLALWSTGTAGLNFTVGLTLGGNPVFTSGVAHPNSTVTDAVTEWTWDIVGITALPTSGNAAVCVSGTYPAFQNVGALSVVNTLSQPVGGIATNSALTLALQAPYTGVGSVAGNAIQLLWLRVEELN